MSDPGRHRLIRAARVLSEAVKIGGSSDLEPELKSPVGEPIEEICREELLAREVEEWRGSCSRLDRELKNAQARVAEMEAEMRSLVEKQKKEMEVFLDQLEKDRELAKKTGYAEGESRGREEGFTQGRSELEAEIRSELEAQLSGTVDTLNMIHEEMRSHLEELLSANPYRLIRLWQKVLSRLLVREVAFDQEAALRLLRNLLARASEKEDVRVYLNPEDLNSIEAQKGSFGDLTRGIRNIEFLPDDEVDKGSCIVETGLGIYDARWRTQLEQISSEIESVLTEGKNRD